LAQPPVARKVPKTDVVHGETRLDDYFWMRDKQNPDVADHLHAENAWADEVMKGTAALQERLYQEMKGHIKETDLSVPYRFGAWWYYTRTEEGKQYPIFCRKRSPSSHPSTSCSTSTSSAAGSPSSRSGPSASPDDANLLAYSLDTTGFRQYTLQVKNLTTGEVLPDRIEKTAPSCGPRTARRSSTRRGRRQASLPRLSPQLGAPGRTIWIYEEKDERFSVAVRRSRSRSGSSSKSRATPRASALPVRARARAENGSSIAPREDEHEYDIAHHGDRFYIRTNSGGRNFRLMSAPIADPRRENWTEVLGHRPDVMLEGMDFFKGTRS
jgi:oligopeptidase B